MGIVPPDLFAYIGALVLVGAFFLFLYRQSNGRSPDLGDALLAGIESQRRQFADRAERAEQSLKEMKKELDDLVRQHHAERSELFKEIGLLQYQISVLSRSQARSDSPLEQKRLKTWSAIYDLLNDCFDLAELRGVVFKLKGRRAGFDWDNLEGETKMTKIISLLNMVYRFRMERDLLEILKQERPELDWPEVNGK